MAQRKISGTLSFRRRCWLFFHTRCLAGFPWFWPARPLGEHVMVKARRIVRQHFGRNYHPTYRRLAQVLATLAWPPAVLIHLWTIRYDVVMPIRRIPGALWTAMRHNILPSEYFGYQLWLPDRRANIDNYFYCNEAARLFKVLNRPSQPDPIDDKLEFHDLCKAHGLPTPAVLAAFAPTGKLLEFEAGRPPKRALFVKPRSGFGGDGVERFRWDDVAFENDRGCRLTTDDLDRYLATRARNENRTLLVQPLLSNHPDLCVDGALVTARLVTGCPADGDIAAIFGFVYFARFDDRRRIEPWHFEGLIDVSTGQLISGPVQDSPGIIYRHGRFESDGARTMPDWDTALGYAKAAHRACSNFAFVGWDLAFSDQGPLLLEGNATWSPGTYQHLRGEPLGHTKFAAILATRLDSNLA
jgi:Sugar-transfer associated ATP-grasp